MMDFLLHHTALAYFTQSLWRDEAFSILLALKPIAEVFKLTFEPPLYYILLHFWVKIFGTGEIAVRSLSLIAFILASGVVSIWGEKLFKKHWLSWYLPAFFFLNPMLLYYAFEARAYGWYIFFTIVSLYCYSEKKWTLLIISTSLGLYTHAYMIFVPIVEFIHFMYAYITTPSRSAIKKLFTHPFIKSLLVITLIYMPWVIKLYFDLSRLNQSWYFPVDAQLVKSVLANIFLGFEGTPNFLWPLTAKISVILFFVFLYTFSDKKNRSRNLLFLMQVFVPLIIVIGISFYKPIFVNRYMIPCTIAEIFLIVFALETIRNPFMQKLMAVITLVGIVLFTYWYSGVNVKQDIRKTLLEVHALATSRDVIMVDDALLLFESMYYSPKNTRIYWYNPKNHTFPWYIGDAIFSSTQSVNTIPEYPTRAFIIHRDGTFEITYSSQPILTSRGKKLIRK